MQVGSVTFGPAVVKVSPDDLSFQYRQRCLTVTADATARACNCVGPQPGQTKCPCMLSAESEKGRRMVADGVTIDGVKYRLVRE